MSKLVIMILIRSGSAGIQPYLDELHPLTTCRVNSGVTVSISEHQFNFERINMWKTQVNTL